MWPRGSCTSRYGPRKEALEASPIYKLSCTVGERPFAAKLRSFAMLEPFDAVRFWPTTYGRYTTTRIHTNDARFCNVTSREPDNRKTGGREGGSTESSVLRRTALTPTGILRQYIYTFADFHPGLVGIHETLVVLLGEPFSWLGADWLSQTSPNARNGTLPYNCVHIPNPSIPVGVFLRRSYFTWQASHAWDAVPRETPTENKVPGFRCITYIGR